MSSPISGFTAIPNPQMLAFMPIQSYLMMYFAGSGWQYGKRKISAMSNEEFNKLTPERLLEQHSDELKRIMPTLTKTLNDVTPLIRILVEQYGDFIKEAINAIPATAGNIFGEQAGANLQSNIQGFNDILSALAKILPSLPQAEARRPGVQQTTGARPPSTFTTPTGIQVPIIKTPPPFQGPSINPKTGETTFIPPKELPPPIGITFKKGAGQSQRLEKAKLIQSISNFQITVEVIKKQLVGTSGLPRKNIMGNFSKVVKQLNQHKQMLSNLLARYRF